MSGQQKEMDYIQLGRVHLEGYKLEGHEMEGHKMEGHKTEGHKLEGHWQSTFRGNRTQDQCMNTFFKLKMTVTGGTAGDYQQAIHLPHDAPS